MARPDLWTGRLGIEGLPNIPLESRNAKPLGGDLRAN